MSLANLGTLISALAAILFLLVTLITFRTRRLGREARELRELRSTNVAFARRQYQIDLLAARRGWDTDPSWPAMPKELTPEYLEGRAEGENNAELANLAQVMTQLQTLTTVPHPEAGGKL